MTLTSIFRFRLLRRHRRLGRQLLLLAVFSVFLFAISATFAILFGSSAFSVIIPSPLRFRFFKNRQPLPDFSTYYRLEDSLPQHRKEAALPSDKRQKYVKFSTHVRGLGWNNVLSEL